jgi:hypothetical protein
MTDEPEIDRRSITFEQAEGVDPLPQQLKPREVLDQLRALTWHVIYKNMESDTENPSMGGEKYFKNWWKNILYDWYVGRQSSLQISSRIMREL